MLEVPVSALATGYAVYGRYFRRPCFRFQHDPNCYCFRLKSDDRLCENLSASGHVGDVQHPSAVEWSADSFFQGRSRRA